MTVIILILNLLLVLLVDAREIQLDLGALLRDHGGLERFRFRLTRDRLVMGCVGEPLEGLVYRLLDHLEGVLALPRVAGEGREDVAGAGD